MPEQLPAHVQIVAPPAALVVTYVVLAVLRYAPPIVERALRGDIVSVQALQTRGIGRE